MRKAFLAACIVLLAGPAFSQTLGWRGNWTGLYPDANPPTEWGRANMGPAGGMTCQAAKPDAAAAKSGRPLAHAQPVEWLIIGPFPVEDVTKDFDKEQIPGEAQMTPVDGAKAGGLAWRKLDVAPVVGLGPTELDWIDLGKPFGFKTNQVGYAHTWLWAERAGKARIVMEHNHGMALWLNGKEAYRSANMGAAFGSWPNLSRIKLGFANPRSPSCDVEFRQGWNRLLVKIGTEQANGWRSMHFTMRIIDAEPVPYADKNIAWATKLPERSHACPIIVGDRIFVAAEPDWLLCIDKKSGKVLWKALTNIFETTPAAERAADARFKEVEALQQEMMRTEDFDRSLDLRGKIQGILAAVNPKRYAPELEGHLSGHFAIVGFCTTPTSDGKNVYVFYGTGVAACYDLDGNRKWITRIPVPEKLVYPCSPALIGGRFCVFMEKMFGLDAATGALLWDQPGVERACGSLIAGRIRGVDVALGQKGEVVRVSDGKLLWQNPRKITGDTGWNPPTIIGDTVYLPWYGAGNLVVLDFSECSGDAWQPKQAEIGDIVVNKLPNGQWIDRWSAASWLIHENIGYVVDIYGIFYAVDLRARRLLYRQQLDFDSLDNYVAVGLTASPALGGRNIYVMNNQGTCYVLAPGREFKIVAKNRLETVLPRVWPITPQEITAYAPPVFDGNRLYIRGEQYLYCIAR